MDAGNNGVHEGMKRCDHCNRLKFRLPVTHGSLRFCSEACKGGRMWDTLLSAADKPPEIPINLITFTPKQATDALEFSLAAGVGRGGGVN